MINNLHRHKVGLTIGFIVAFSSVFVGDFLCDFGVISVNHQCSIDNNDNHHFTDDHESEISHKHGSDDLVNKDHHQSSDGQLPEDCCDDMTSALYSSLIKNTNEVANIIPAKIVLLYEISFNNFYLNIKPLFFKEAFIFCDLPPPLKGYDIRIIIQSFLN